MAHDSPELRLFSLKNKSIIKNPDLAIILQRIL